MVLYILPGIVIATFNTRVVVTLYSRQSLDMAISLDSIRDNGSIRSSLSADHAFKKQLENRRRVRVEFSRVQILSYSYYKSRKEKFISNSTQYSDIGAERLARKALANIIVK